MAHCRRKNQALAAKNRRGAKDVLKTVVDFQGYAPGPPGTPPGPAPGGPEARPRRGAAAGARGDGPALQDLAPEWPWIFSSRAGFSPWSMARSREARIRVPTFFSVQERKER